MVFKVTAFLKSNISYKVFYRTLIGNHAQYIEWYHFQWPWVTSDSDFMVTTFLKSNIGKTAGLKVTISHNRKLYITYGMVLCLMILTDLWTRRAGLSASAGLLVFFQVDSKWAQSCAQTFSRFRQFCNVLRKFIPLWRWCEAQPVGILQSYTGAILHRSK